MNTLIIYDQAGFILGQMSGDVREPVGIPFMWVEVPQGKYVVSIDVSGDVHVPIYAEYPKSEVQTLIESQIEPLKELVDTLIISTLEV